MRAVSKSLVFIFLAAEFLLFAPPVIAAEEEVSVSARVDRSEVPVGEKLLFEIVISGPIRETPKVQIEKLEGFKVVSTGQSQQVRVQSGKVSQTLLLSYTLLAAEAGTRMLGPVKVEVQGRKFETRPVEVKVTPGPAEPPDQKASPPPEQMKGEVIL